MSPASDAWLGMGGFKRGRPGRVGGVVTTRGML